MRREIDYCKCHALSHCGSRNIKPGAHLRFRATWMAVNPCRASQCARRNVPTCTGVLASVLKLYTGIPIRRRAIAAIISRKPEQRQTSGKASAGGLPVHKCARQNHQSGAALELFARVTAGVTCSNSHPRIPRAHFYIAVTAAALACKCPVPQYATCRSESTSAETNGAEARP